MDLQESAIVPVALVSQDCLVQIIDDQHDKVAIQVNTVSVLEILQHAIA